MIVSTIDFAGVDQLSASKATIVIGNFSESMLLATAELGIPYLVTSDDVDGSVTSVQKVPSHTALFMKPSRSVICQAVLDVISFHQWEDTVVVYDDSKGDDTR